MESQAQMTAGDQGIAEDLAAAQEGAVPDGHYQAQVGTVQDGKVPRAGHAARAASAAASPVERRSNEDDASPGRNEWRSRTSAVELIRPESP